MNEFNSRWRLDVAEQRALLEALAAELSDKDDEVFANDRIEGETDALELIDFLIALESDYAGYADRQAQLATEARERRARWLLKAEKIRAARETLAAASGQRKLKLPSGAIMTRAKGAPKVEIDPGAQLPDRFLAIEVRPKREDLRAALSAGERIDGARLVSSGEIWRVRR